MSTTVGLTHEEIDHILEDHFRWEGEGDVEGALGTFTDDVVHDVVGDPAGVLHGPAAVGVRYRHLFSNAKAQHVDVTRRLYGDDFAVDDKIWTARVDGVFLGLPGQGRSISIRVLHVFESRDGRICRENVWLDAGAAIAQLAEADQSAVPDGTVVSTSSRPRR
jgi:steroid delta-isomerase-like uncharacterized protein